MKRIAVLKIEHGDEEDRMVDTIHIPVNDSGPIVWEPVDRLLRNKYKNCIVLNTKYINAMRAILIDSDNQVVREVNISQDNFLQDSYRNIGNGCQMIEYVHYVNLKGHGMYVDEEGLFNTAEKGFSIENCVFVGNALIFGDDGEGNETDATLTLEEIESIVSWVPDVSQYKPQ